VGGGRPAGGTCRLRGRSARRVDDADSRAAAREVYLLQRTKGSQGKRLGKTSGWVPQAR
jgi:hypothetical protein